MARSKAPRGKKYFTTEQSQQMLPLVRAIVQDIVDLARRLCERQERLLRICPEPDSVGIDRAHREEIDHVQHELAHDAARMEEYLDELRRLGVELKSWDGLVDFPSWLDDREICLCWKLGEADIAHWHEIDAGFAGRQKLFADSVATISTDSLDESQN